MYSTKFGLCAQNMIITLGLVVYISQGTYISFNEHEYLHFDNEPYIHMSSQNDEENGYNMDCSNLV